MGNLPADVGSEESGGKKLRIENLRILLNFLFSLPFFFTLLPSAL
jgi:hypothetical protein